MKYFRAMLVGATLLTGASTWAAAQAVVPVQWAWGQRNNNSQAFRDGYRQGRWDAEHRQSANYGNTGSWRSNDDRLAFRNGYIQGYREVNGAYRGSGPYDRDGDGDRDDGYGRGAYGRGGFGNYAANARQFGYQDGFNDGQNDRRTGHSFRPTHDDNYKHADRGYDGRFGNKDSYKQAYRDAYSQGYQNGYNGGGWQRR
jgi:hypothetical protein